MALLPHSTRDPTQRQLGRSESNVDYFDQIAAALPILETELVHYRIDLGKGKRLIVRGGRYDREFRITVPGRFGAER